MRPSLYLGLLGVAALVAGPRPVLSQTPSPIGGVWALNAAASDPPRELGFTPAWAKAAAENGAQAGTESEAGGGGGRGRRGSGGGRGRGSSGAPSFPRESYDDAQRLRLLSDEARTPPKRLMIVDTPSAVTITNELGQSRTLHPTGKTETIETEGLEIVATTTRDADRLVIVYQVEPNREVRYTYSRATTGSQLVVETELLDHGSGDKVRRVYDPGIASDNAAPSTTATATPPTSSPAGASPAAAHEVFDERPGAELRGIKTLGILVEDLSAQATACGLSHDTLQSALSKRLTDAGFTVRTNTDEDTYVYVNVITDTLSNGTCVSRYDAFLYTHATANLSYRDKPVLVQVSLMHRGGIGASAPTPHAAAVTRGLEGYLDVFASQIHDANK